MESSTIQNFDQQVPNEKRSEHPIIKEDWKTVVKQLPTDLEQSARKHQALLRRREIRSAEDLLHLSFLYALPDWSLRMAAMQATQMQICNISDVDLMRRLQEMRAWLGTVVVQMLQERGIPLKAQKQGRLKIIDATGISRPGSQGTDMRLHLSIDLQNLSIDQVRLTDAHGGEGFWNFSLDAQDILVADSNYVRTRSLEIPLGSGSKVVARQQWNTMPVYNQDGKQFDIIAWLKRTFSAGETAPAETQVWLPTTHGLQPLRLVACPLPPEKAEQARERARKKSYKKKHKPMENNLYAAGFVILLTNLSVELWSTEWVLQLYRWRWQIELYIKRLKSLLELDHLRTQNPDLAQTYLLTKLLAAILVDRMRSAVGEQVPDLFDDGECPISIWRLDLSLIQTLTTWIIGDPPTWEQFLEMVPRLKRYLCGSHRKRPQQLAVARSRLAILCAC